MQTSYGDHNLWFFMKSFYYILLGDYGDFKGMDPNTALSDDIYFFTLLAVTVIMVILMLNMLIALISESHGDVMKFEHQASIYEKLQLIIGIKSSFLAMIKSRLFSADKENSKNNYLFFLQSQKYVENKTLEVSDQIADLKKEILAFRTKFENLVVGQGSFTRNKKNKKSLLPQDFNIPTSGNNSL